MNTHATHPRQLIALLIFALACFGLTLFMWITFGGSSPLKPTGYHLTVPMKDAGLITNQADVRIAGVNVGKVIGKTLDRKHDVTDVELNLFPEYAPRPADTQVVLRQKTLLGETYLELSPGSPKAAKLHDGSTLAEGTVSRAVHLDDVLRTFDPTTRQAFEDWLTDQGAAVSNGGGQALNAALAQLQPLGHYGKDALALFRSQNAALKVFIRDGGTALGAFTQRRGALRSFVENGERLFKTTAARDTDLAETFHVFPTFLKESRLTFDRIGTFSDNAVPLLQQLQPAARATTPVLVATRKLAPDLERLLVSLGPLADAAKRGVPKLAGILDPTVPLLKRAKPWLGTIIPVIQYFTKYKRDFAGLFGNIAAASQATLPATDGSGPKHYVRSSLPINPEALATFPSRISSNRGNAYPAPGNYDKLATGLEEYTPCTTSPEPTLSDSIEAASKTEIQDFYFTANPNGPTCKNQAPLGSATGFGSGQYPTLKALP